MDRCFLVEWYQRVPTRDAHDVSRRLSGAGLDVLAVVSVPTDEMVFGVIRADTADAINTVCRAAGWPADRITPDVSAHVP